MRPTLFSPPKCFWLVSWLSTTTGSGPSSAAADQPWPNWNGTSNIGKNSPVVTRSNTRAGFDPWRPESSTAPDLYMITLRCGMSERCSAVVSRYVISSGGISVSSLS